MMTTNILEAIANIIQHPIYDIKAHYSGRNRMNNVGEALETFVKDAFANAFLVENEQEKMKAYNQVFS